VTKTAKGSVNDTVAKLSELVEARGLKLFAIVNHSGETRRAGLELRDTKVVIFGSSEAGTPVMQSVPLVALDLPLKRCSSGTTAGRRRWAMRLPVLLRRATT